MKYIHLNALFLMVVFHSSCGQNQTNVPQDNIKPNKTGPYTESQLKEAATSKVPVSMVRNVKQARNGDILIASYLGVFRYDGTSFINISNEISSPYFSSFWDVLEDRKGNLWFGTRDSGVYLLPLGQTTFQHFTTKDGLASNLALHIYEDKAGNIWVGASRYDPSASLRAGEKSFRNFTTKDGFPSNSIRLLLEDKTGKLWFGEQGENMFVYDPSATLRTGGKAFTVLKNKDGKAFNNVWSIIEDKKGNIWFGDVDGLWRYDGSTFTNVSQRGAYAIIEDKKGNIWTTGEVNPKAWALSRYDAKSLYDKTPTVTEIMSGPPAFLGLLEANDGSIWFGGLGPQSGVYRYDGKTITNFISKANFLITK
jgi:ligand-binding sensor domain-containing protein